MRISSVPAAIDGTNPFTPPAFMPFTAITVIPLSSLLPTTYSTKSQLLFVPSAL